MREDWRRAGALLTAGLIVGGVGCGGSSNAPEGTGLHGSVQAGLVQSGDCSDLLRRIQNDAIAKLDLVLVRAREAGPTGGEWGYAQRGYADDVVSTPAPPMDANSAEGAAGGDADSDGDSDGDVGGSGTGQASSPTGGSDTNTQVEGVDEADFIKVVEDRTRIYVLHGNQLFTLNSWPASETSLVGEPADIEGSPIEMFVHQGKAVVFSSFYDYDGRLSGASGSSTCSPWSCSGNQFVKVTILDVAGTTPQVLRELYYEGSYNSSRRYDSVVRVVVQASRPYQGLFSPDIEWFDPWGREYDAEVIEGQLREWYDRTVASIRGTTLEDWLPPAFTRVSGELEPLEPSCGSYFVPVAGLTDYGLTNVLSLSLEEPNADVGGVTIMGWTSLVYSNLEHLVLAQPDYRWSTEMDWGFVDEQQTALHLFDIQGAETRYQASGWVPGHPLNQFSLDESGDAVRVSTTGFVRVNPDAAPNSEAFWQQRVVNQVLAVQAAGGQLRVTSSTGPLGEEGETIRSTRFLGDRGYVVTFRQTDPLFVIDLSDPANLRVLGELHIPGFSEYMHPLGDNHLLTIGRDATNEGQVRGLMLQIFDVSNDTEPTLVQRYAFSDGSYSAASYDHKAFTFYADRGLLAFPMTSYESSFSSTLQLFRVSTEDGFEPLGAVDHTALFADSCLTTDELGETFWYSCYYSPDIRRGLFINDENNTFVYSLSYGGMMVHDLSNLATPVATVPLPTPRMDDSYYYYGGGMVEPGIEPVEPMPSRGDAGVPEGDPAPDAGA